MPNTYSQLNVQCVFAVKGRDNIITKDFREELHKYMYGILKNDDAFPLAVGGWKDHVHVFFELPVKKSVSELMRMLKATSSKWINDNKLIKGKFSWQEGYGAFSYSRSQRDEIIQYVINQEAHHQNITFKEEYLKLLNIYDIPFKNEYLFEFYD
jgi:putative transposase